MSDVDARLVQDEDTSQSREVSRSCEVCMGTGGVMVPCMDCKNGVPDHSHKCKACGGSGTLASSQGVDEQP